MASRAEMDSLDVHVTSVVCGHGFEMHGLVD
jgi:hypothetical protein